MIRNNKKKHRLNVETKFNIQHDKYKTLFIVHKAGTIIYSADILDTDALLMAIEKNKDFDFLFIASYEEEIHEIENDISNVKKLRLKLDNIEAKKEYAKSIRDFNKKFGFKPDDLYLAGSTKIGHSNTLIKKLIPYIIMRHRNEKGTIEEKKNYKCFADENWGKDKGSFFDIIHEDFLSAWNGLLLICGSPDYGIIIKEYI